MNTGPQRVRGHLYAHSAVLALGGNLGRRLDNLQAALDALVDTPGLVVTGVSAIYETEPFGGPPGEPGSVDLSGQPNYFNAVVGIVTDLPAQTLLVRTQAIEQALHRVREERWAPRTIDVDIIIYDDMVSDDEALTVPHPRAHERLFVLLPWKDVDPAAEIPGRGPIATLLDAFDGTRGVMRRDDLTLQL
jgi:2-amino-4-hydroxy-6-hydroxymethyldihydropteridine diphosphokinase